MYSKHLAEAQAARFKHFMDTATEAEFNEFMQWRAARATDAPADKTRLTYLEEDGVTASASRYPITWDKGTQAYTAATLTDGDRILVEAVNVYAFEGALKLGDGKRSKRFMLFELAEVVPVSELHVAVGKMNTHYFEHGTFERRAFNKKNVRPATAPETLEYLNAKYKYLSKI